MINQNLIYCYILPYTHNITLRKCIKYYQHIQILQTHPDFNVEEVLYYSLSGGYLHLIQHFKPNDIIEKQSFMFNDMEICYISKATENGHLDIVKYLVSLGADVKTNDSYSILLASENGNLEMVKYLIKEGIDIETRNGYVLVRASSSGNLELVKYLVSLGLNNKYALPDASIEGHLEIVKFLVESGVNSENSENIYFRAFSLACIDGHLHIIKYLCSLNINIKKNIINFPQIWRLLDKYPDISNYIKNQIR